MTYLFDEGNDDERGDLNLGMQGGEEALQFRPQWERAVEVAQGSAPKPRGETIPANVEIKEGEHVRIR